MGLLGGFGGSAPAIGKAVEEGVEAADKATGGRLAMAKSAMNAAAPAAGAVAQGAGLRVGWTIGGIFNLLLNAAKNTVPEFGSNAGFIGVYVWVIVIVYWMSWVAGFAPDAVLKSHAILAFLGFCLFLLAKGLSFQNFRYYGIVFSVIMIIDYILLKGIVHWYLLLIAALLMAFREGNPVEDAKRVLLVMVVASIGYYAFNRFSDLLVLPFFAKLSLPLGLDNFLFFTAVLANRTVTFPFLWYAIFGLNKETRVARSLAWFVMLLLIFAFWPQISPEVSKIRGQYSGATAEQKAVVPTLFEKAGISMRNIGASLGDLLSAKTAYAYEKTQETFGFGQPKEQPKLGLALVQDSTMLRKYDISYKKPEPSFIMRITSPFPAGAEKPYLEVTGISCNDKMGKLNFKPGITSKGITPTKDEPIAVFYNGPDGGAQVKCPTDVSKWETGDYTISASVDYKVDATAFLTTAFIRADQDEALRKKGIDPAVVNKIPPATARYDNVPVTLTWGPPDLTKSPASIELDKPARPDLELPGVVAPLKAATTQNMLITVYVSKNSGWENSEIKEVKGLTLTAPSGVKLVGDSCDFDIKNAKTNPDGTTEYKVSEGRISKVVEDSKKMQPSVTGYAVAMPRFIGDAIRFECGMRVSGEALSGADWAPARFDVSGSFIFTTKLDSISFTVEGGEKAGTVPASPPPISCGSCYTPDAAGTSCVPVKNGIQGGCASGYVCNGAGSCTQKLSSPP